MLKTKIQQIEENGRRKEKIINGLMDRLRNFSGMDGLQQAQSQVIYTLFQTHLIKALKEKLKTSQFIVKEKEAEIQQLKRSTKITNLWEYETRLNTAEAECGRLREMLDEITSEKHKGNPVEYIELEKQLLQKTVLNKKLQKENTELSSALVEEKAENQSLFWITTGHHI